MSYALPEFLAHAIAMEKESAERYLELADMMETYNNREVSELFREMNKYSNMHHDSVLERAGSIALPVIKSWQYRWTSPPEMTDEDAFNRELDVYTALQYAHLNEIRAMDYYQSVAAESGDPEVIRLATEFAAEEQEHAAALDRWLSRTLRPAVTFADDPEPGVMEKHR